MHGHAPSLDQLAADPSRVASLPAETRANLMARLSALILVVLTTPGATVARADADTAHGGGSKGQRGWLTAGQLAEHLNLPESWVRTEERAGRIPGIRAGRYVRFKLADVEDALSHHKGIEDDR
jgi:excisionase family DNA binding protein